MPATQKLEANDVIAAAEHAYRTAAEAGTPMLFDDGPKAHPLLGPALEALMKVGVCSIAHTGTVFDTNAKVAVAAINPEWLPDLATHEPCLNDLQMKLVEKLRAVC